LCFTPPSKLTPPTTPPHRTSLFISNSILHFAQNKRQADHLVIIIYSPCIIWKWIKEKQCASCLT
jgi:hypothetical protein